MRSTKAHRNKKTKKRKPKIMGRPSNNKSYVGYCHNIQHRGWITLALLVEHDCLGKECSLFDLSNWHLYKNEFSCSTEANFKIVFCDLEIEGREVRKWQQPLCEAYGKALFVLFVATAYMS